MGADDLPPESRVNQLRHPADVIDVGMGQKQKIDVAGSNGKLVEGEFGVAAIGLAAVHEDIHTDGGLHQVA